MVERLTVGRMKLRMEPGLEAGNDWTFWKEVA